MIPSLPISRTTVLTSEAGVTDAALRARWKEMLASSHHFDASFQSPGWFDHVRTTSPAAVVQVRGDDGVICGVVPVVKDAEELEFSAGRYFQNRVNFKAAIVLGGEPLIPSELGTFDEVLAAVDRWAADCDCLSLQFVPKDSFAWRSIHESRFVRENYRIYVPLDAGAGDVYAIDLPSTFQEYSASLGSKRRANFKRKITVLEKNGRPPRLRRFEAPGEVAEFFELANGIAQKTWQRAMGVHHFDPSIDWQAKWRDLAARGVFRGFVLYCGDTPGAFGVGYEDEGTFHFRATGFDADLAPLSPGTVLIFCMIEDLLGVGRARRMCFCFGAAAYKRLFANVKIEVSRVLLLRRTAKNELLWRSHTAFRRLVRVAATAMERMQKGDRAEKS